MEGNNLIKKYSTFIPITISFFLFILFLVFNNFNNNVAVVFYVLSFLIGGYKQGVESIKEIIYDKKLSVEFLMMISCIFSSLIGHLNEAIILLLIFSFSGSLEEYTNNNNKNEIRKLMNLSPKKVKRITKDKSIEEINTEDIKIGDKLLILKGDSIPIDGTISKGSSKFDESTITGESVSNSKEVGEMVYYGTINIWKPIEMIVKTSPEETILYKIVKMVEEAQNKPTKIKSFIDNAENLYIKLVMSGIFSFFLISIFLLNISFQEAFYKSILLLVVSSPCALIASTTPAILSSVTSCAKNGILVKGGKYLELLKDTKFICMDKTGTLTYGEPKLIDFFLLENNSYQQTAEAILALEQYSSHTLAKTITNNKKIFKIAKKNMDKNNQFNVEDYVEKSGYGIEGKYKNNKWKFGNSKYINDKKIDPQILKRINNLTYETIIYIQKNNKTIGFFSFADKVRDNSKDVIKKLKNMGVKVILLTGDNKITTQKIAKDVGIEEYYYECLPEDKANLLEKIKKNNKIVTMVGDGINDAPSLSIADIGIVMGKGSDLAIDSGNIVLIDNQIKKIYFLLKLSKKLNLIILENIIFASFVVILLIISSFNSIINLPIGVIGHEFSTILVILNGLRMLRFQINDI